MYDMKNMAKFKQLDESAADGMKAFWEFNTKAMAPGALDAKTKELIALGVALTTQCVYCIELHTQAARKAGATDAELAEAALVTAALRAGGALTHATHMFK